MKTRIPYTDIIALDELTIDGLLACDLRVSVAFTLTRAPDEFTFESVHAVGNVWFYTAESDIASLKFAPGDDLLPRLDAKQIAMLEDKLMDSLIHKSSN